MYDLEKGFELAKELYAAYGVDVEKAMALCDETPLSIHCWQGDDVRGFDQDGGDLTGGIQTTGNYPGRRRRRRSCARIWPMRFGSFRARKR